MARFRPKLGLKALLAIVACCAVVALVKLENDPRRDFAAKETIITSVLSKILPKVDESYFTTRGCSKQKLPTPNLRTGRDSTGT